jgi:hypothetical protein
MRNSLDCQQTHSVILFWFNLIYTFSLIYMIYNPCDATIILSSWKITGKRMFQRKISLAGKGSSTDKEEIMGRGIGIMSLIYTRPTDVWPWTGLKLLVGLYNTTCDRMILYSWFSCYSKFSKFLIFLNLCLNQSENRILFIWHITPGF